MALPLGQGGVGRRADGSVNQQARSTFELQPDQQAAFERFMQWLHQRRDQTFYLAGYAGTGKTTLIRGIIDYVRTYVSADSRIPVLTLTGKAASVLHAKGVHQAQTIHSYLYRCIPYENEDGTQDLYAEPKDTEIVPLIVVDEASMVPGWIADDLKRTGARIVAVYDPGQLPPVFGKGELMAEFGKEHARLSIIKRQADEDPILKLADGVRHGRRPPKHGRMGDSVYVIPGDRAASTIKSFFDPKNTITIAYRNATCASLTRMIREHLGYTGDPQKGERITCRTNDSDMRLYNGLQGTLVEDAVRDSYRDPRIGKRLGYRLRVLFDGHRHPITLDRVDAHYFRYVYEPELKPRPPFLVDDAILFAEWGYALTCHRAQGSEWDRVIVMDESADFEEPDRWLYTAVTRAAKRLYLVSDLKVKADV